VVLAWTTPVADILAGLERLHLPRVLVIIAGFVVRQDVAFGPAYLGVTGSDLDARVQRALEQVAMSDAADRAPHHLSFGQRRRVCLATVLSMHPTLLVFDEPSANLDPFARRELADLIRAAPQTTLVVTHDLLYAAELCPRAVIIDNGAIVADGPTPALLADADLFAAHRLELPRFPTLEPYTRPDPPGEQPRIKGSG
jgi:cobalt/nickel transport system ATP-binding protein